MNNSPLSLVQSLMIITKPLISVLFLYFFFILSSFPSPSHCNVDDSQSFLDQCSLPYECGNITNISYPFWGGSRPQYCGHPEFELRCITYSKDQHPVIEINGLEFKILNINGSNGASGSLRIARLDLWDGLCSSKVRFVNTTLNYNLFFDSAPTVNDELFLFYNCTQPPNYLLLSLGDSSTCGAEMTEIVYYANQTLLESLDSVNLKACKNVVQVPVLRTAFDHHEVNALAAYQSGIFTFSRIDEVLNQGFQVEYNKTIRSLCEQCERSGGTCGSDNTTLKFLCFCRDHTHDFACTGNRKGLNWKVKAAIGIGGTGILLLLIMCILICRIRKTWSTKIWTKNDQHLEAIISDLTVRRYRFSDIKKMTESFKLKLGKGGYGEVYRGKLLDGRLVAVKVLNTSKGNGQDFINEVASIFRTSHVNIVSLFGFCLEGSKRALIYEFMPNGSLEQFIYSNNSNLDQHTKPQLTWEKLLQIATGIARGLEYLHRGCNTRILHFDIKPHNILLDEDLCPKISDFGLAKLCTRKESIISFSGARGTFGYIAPEVCDRNYGEVSSKSDVYSYGMMILEMVGGRKNLKLEVSRTSEIYFPDWIYKQLERGSNLQLQGITTSEESEIAKKMIMVGLWCIQTKPSDRPYMNRVIEMLEGSIETLHVPPKPTIFSRRLSERAPVEPPAQ